MDSGRINCKNEECRFHLYEGMCRKDEITINDGGKCSSFDKGVVFYFRLVWNSLRNSNFILPQDLTDDLRIGLHFVMRTFHLVLNISDRGTWRMLSLCTESDKTPLTAEDICKMEIDKEEFDKIIKEVMEGNLPKIEKEKPKKDEQPFGWLSPSGEFFEGDYGSHEKVAIEIIKSKGLWEGWKGSEYDLAREYLSGQKGYCLIHNPVMDGGYIVTHVKDLTKAQREFLYGYFTDMGDRLKAELYLKED